MSTQFTKIQEIMQSQGSSTEEIAAFRELFLKYLGQKSKILDWNKISTPRENTILEYEQLPDPEEKELHSLLSVLAVCKLNGGLGTSMGCVGPKSALVVREGKTFLDLIVSQIQCLNESKRKVKLNYKS